MLAVFCCFLFNVLRVLRVVIFCVSYVSALARMTDYGVHVSRQIATYVYMYVFVFWDGRGGDILM